jgi:hypothetical protein
MYLAHLKWTDGEQEYNEHIFVRADEQAEAELKTDKYLSEMWDEDTHKEGEGYAPPEGYPIVCCDGISRVETMEDVLQRMTVVL